MVKDFVWGLFLASCSAAVSSMGFGGGVVVIVYPIQLPIANIPIKAIATGAAISQKWTSACVPMFIKDLI